MRTAAKELINLSYIGKFREFKSRPMAVRCIYYLSTIKLDILAYWNN